MKSAAPATKIPFVSNGRHLFQLPSVYPLTDSTHATQVPNRNPAPLPTLPHRAAAAASPVSGGHHARPLLPAGAGSCQAGPGPLRTLGPPARSREGGDASFPGSIAPELLARISRPVRQPCLWSSSSGSSPSPPSWSSLDSPRTRQARGPLCICNLLIVHPH